MNLEFWRGTELQDPKSLLEGTGKKLRHVKIKAMSEIDDAYIKKLLEESIERTKSN